ncbi:MAG: sulfatase [Candidatus Omnitrophica bacterium]|nr:sulfatase [Candidatus Omnitrophota bacterium]
MKKKPNILWISFEDTNPFYGCYGDKIARTPNIDRFAKEGCIYTNCFSTSGVCAPARSAIITGMYPSSIGTHHMRTTHKDERTPQLPTPYSALIPHYVKCFTEYLRAEGYYCTNNVKTDYQFEPPFTAWDECSENAHWRNRESYDQPFFAVFNPMKTHESGMWEENCPKITFDPKEIKLPPYFPDTEKVRIAMARMYTNIEVNDRIFGEILSQLKEDGLAENTVVFHFSDHGPLPRGKRWLYDTGIHVPLIIRWPGHIKPASVSRRLISTIDLGPTVLSIAGIKPPCYMQGIPFLGKYAQRSRKYVFASRDRIDESYDMVRVVRDKRYKYIKNFYPGTFYHAWVDYLNKHPIMEELWRLYVENNMNETQRLLFQKRPAEEFYDTEKDPWEIRNLIDYPIYKKHVERMRKALEDWMRNINDMGHISEEEMVRNWYAEKKQPETATPIFIPINQGNFGVDAICEGGTYSFKGSLIVQIYCATQGASIGYKINNGRWQLYTNPIYLTKGK